jgi:hypothetical protein
MQAALSAPEQASFLGAAKQNNNLEIAATYSPSKAGSALLKSTEPLLH